MLLKWLAGIGFAVVIAAELMGSINISSLDARLKAEVAQARLRAAAYSRRSISGEPLDENPANWYRRAFAEGGTGARYARCDPGTAGAREGEQVADA